MTYQYFTFANLYINMSVGVKVTGVIGGEDEVSNRNLNMKSKSRCESFCAEFSHQHVIKNLSDSGSSIQATYRYLFLAQEADHT